MSTGLLALLDDVVALAKVAAASTDDIAGLSAKAGAKSMGVVIDDAAVTPRYAVGFAPARELPIIWRIARGSVRNKLLILLPGALLLSLFAPWAITPILMLGGAFLCFEGAEKVGEALGWGDHGDHGTRAEKTSEQPDAGTPKELEDQRVYGAINTDLILSAEIMAITLAGLAGISFWQQAAVLAIVGLGITALVYGAVALIVKADDIGLALARRETAPALMRALGGAIVKGMPHVLAGLAVVGTVAMLWVGGGILLHGLDDLGAGLPAHAVHGVAAFFGHLVPPLQGALTWLINAALSALVGLGVGLALVPVVTKILIPVARRVAGRA